MGLLVREFKPSDESDVQECCRAAYSAVFDEVSDDWKPKAHHILEQNIIGRGLSDIADGLSRRREGVGWVADADGEVRAEPLPLSGAMKVLKRELREPYWKGHEKRIG